MVKKTALLACVLCAGSVYAQWDDSRSVTSFESQPWRIAPEVSHYRYREPGTMTNEGTLYGIVASYLFDDPAEGPCSWLNVGGNDTITFEGRLSFGEVDYDGSYMNGGPLSMNGDDDLLIDLRLLWGRPLYDIELFDAVHVGLGYRYLGDDSSSHPAGYRRQSNYLYIPLGSRKDFELADRWALSLTGEVDVLLIGRQISHLSDVDPIYPDVRNWQWPGFGLAFTAEVLRRGEDVSLGLAPFVRYWWVDDSSTNSGYYEPENNTIEYGLSFVVRF